MEFAKETYFFAKDSALDFWRHACALTYLQTPLPCRGRYAAPTLALLIPCLCWEWRKSITLAGLFWSKFRERSAKDRRKARELVARFRTSPASASGKGE